MSKWLIILLIAVAPALAQRYKTASTGAPPGEVPAPIRDVLRTSGVKIVDPRGYTFCEVWLRSTPVTDSTSLADALEDGSIPQGALVGVIRYAAPGADRKGQGFAAGIYSVRYVGGDAVLLVRAEDDPDLNPPAFEQLQTLSRKVSRTDIPAELRFSKGSGGAAPRLEITGGGEWVLHLAADRTPIDLLVLGVQKD